MHKRCTRAVLALVLSHHESFRQVSCRALSSSSGSTKITFSGNDAGSSLQGDFTALPGYTIFTASLKKPLGFVLSERGQGAGTTGRIFIESVTPGGSAEAAGVRPGDVLLATGARAQSDRPGAGAAPGKLVLFMTDGESFKTVSAAIKSNLCSQCDVHLVFARPLPAADAAGVSGGQEP